jgi:UDP-GlcNAc:undecaprenyl-phosphate GlcNAc-1-phosphate transferase
MSEFFALTLGAVFILSLGLVLYLTPLVRSAAISFGVLDSPDGKLKRHKEPTPYLGGVAVYLAFLISLGMVFDFDKELLGMLLGGTIVTMLGLFDDLRVLTPGLKIMGQLLAIWVLFKSGATIQIASLPVWVTLVLTIAWVVVVTNALNILDVSDGVASGTAAIAALSLTIIALLNGRPLIASAALALCGSCAGFAWFNKAPAKIYLGDTGSMFIGFMLASLTIIGDYAANNSLALLAPLFILFVPLFEVAICSLARLAKGESPLKGSPDHQAIRLKNQGISAANTARIIWGFQWIGSSIGIGLVVVGPESAWIILSAGCIFFVGLLVWFFVYAKAPSWG